MRAASARGCAVGASFRVKTYNAISPIGLEVYDSQYNISPVRALLSCGDQLLVGRLCVSPSSICKMYKCKM